MFYFCLNFNKRTTPLHKGRCTNVVIAFILMSFNSGYHLINVHYPLSVNVWVSCVPQQGVIYLKTLMYHKSQVLTSSSISSILFPIQTGQSFCFCLPNWQHGSLLAAFITSVFSPTLPNVPWFKYSSTLHIPYLIMCVFHIYTMYMYFKVYMISMFLYYKFVRGNYM